MDPAKEAEAVRAFYQGMVRGAMLDSRPILANEWTIDQPTDEEGNYKPYFTVTTPSGIVLRVEVSVEKERD